MADVRNGQFDGGLGDAANAPSGSGQPADTARSIDPAAVAEFLKFLEQKEEYLGNGLGAFHTDDHSNW